MVQNNPLALYLPEIIDTYTESDWRVFLSFNLDKKI